MCVFDLLRRNCKDTSGNQERPAPNTQVPRTPASTPRLCASPLLRHFAHLYEALRYTEHAVTASRAVGYPDQDGCVKGFEACCHKGK